MGAEVFGVDSIDFLALLGGLALVVIAIVQVVRSPALTTGAKWSWVAGLVVS